MLQSHIFPSRNEKKESLLTFHVLDIQTLTEPEFSFSPSILVASETSQSNFIVSFRLLRKGLYTPSTHLREIVPIFTDQIIDTTYPHTSNKGVYK